MFLVTTLFRRILVFRAQRFKMIPRFLLLFSSYLISKESTLTYFVIVDVMYMK